MTSEILQRVAGFNTALAIKAPCVVATAANITLANEQTVNSVAVTAGDRVLVRDQTDQKENGIYLVVANGSWTRTQDFNGPRDIVRGTLVPVLNGEIYELTTPDPTIGASNLTFTQAVLKANSQNQFALPQRAPGTTGTDLTGLNISTNTHFTITPSGADTFSFAGILDNLSGTVLVKNTSGHAITIDTATIEAPDELQESISASGTYLVSYVVPPGESKVYIEITRTYT